MPTNGTGYADKAQAEIERRLRKIYQDAQKELIEKLDKHTKRLNAMDKVKRQQLADGEITQAQYNNWLRGQMFTGQQWKNKVDSLSETMLHANEQANAIIEGKRQAVFGKNALYQSKRIQDDLHMAISFSVYDSASVTRLLRDQPELLPRRKVDKKKDKGWNQENISDAITQGIIQGDSIPEIAKRIATKTASKNEKAMVRYARTAMTGAQNAGRMEMLHEAQDMGIKVKKVWLATLDERTRDAHAKLDGQEVEVDEPFKSEFGDIMYPGDPAANPANTWNCRCTLIYKYDNYVTLNADGVLLKAQTLQNATRYDQENGEVIDYKTYQEWANPQDINKQNYSVIGLSKPKRPNKIDFSNEDDYYKAREKYREELDAYNERLDKIIEKAVNVKRFETKEDVVAWAKENGIDLAPDLLDTIDIRSLNESSMVLDEMFKRFPEVKSYELEDFDGNRFRTSFRIGLDGDGLLSANGGLNFNPRLFADYRNGLREALSQQTDGYLVKADGTFGALVRHEYGHNVQSYIEGKLAVKYHYYVDDWRKNFRTFEEYNTSKAIYIAERKKYKDELLSLVGLSGSSEYSNTNELELFAEGFSAWSSGEKTEFAIKFGEFLKRWY